LPDTDPPAAWVLDLDGVLWLGTRIIDGAAVAVEGLRAAGHRVGFCTNNSATGVAEYVSKLQRAGIPADAADLVSSAMAAAGLLSSGERVLVVGGAGLREAVLASGAEIVSDGGGVDGGGVQGGGVDTVLVGFDPAFDYAAMRVATRAVLGGARLLASNDDPIYPSADGPSPGCGAILASIERATGSTAVVAGKPNPPMCRLVADRFGPRGVVVGDSLGTDGALAAALGWSFGLVLSGNTAPTDVPASQDPAWIAGDLAQLVERRLADGRGSGRRGSAARSADASAP